MRKPQPIPDLQLLHIIRARNDIQAVTCATEQNARTLLAYSALLLWNPHPPRPLVVKQDVRELPIETLVQRVAPSISGCRFLPNHLDKQVLCLRRKEAARLRNEPKTSLPLHEDRLANCRRLHPKQIPVWHESATNVNNGGHVSRAQQLLALLSSQLNCHLMCVRIPRFRAYVETDSPQTYILLLGIVCYHRHCRHLRPELRAKRHLTSLIIHLDADKSPACV